MFSCSNFGLPLLLLCVFMAVTVQFSDFCVRRWKQIEHDIIHKLALNSMEFSAFKPIKLEGIKLTAKHSTTAENNPIQFNAKGPKGNILLNRSVVIREVRNRLEEIKVRKHSQENISTFVGVFLADSLLLMSYPYKVLDLSIKQFSSIKFYSSVLWYTKYHFWDQSFT